MAERRMFSKAIIDSDAFLEMPISAQNLYFHLSMRADDDGFVGNPRSIMRIVKASDDDAKILLSKRFILSFDSGVIVIKHWRINNYIRGDRHHETTYKKEMQMLSVDEKNAYTEKKNNECPSIDNQVTTEISIDKVRLDKNSLDKDSSMGLEFIEPTITEITNYIYENHIPNLKPFSCLGRIIRDQIIDWKNWLLKESARLEKEFK